MKSRITFYILLAVVQFCSVANGNDVLMLDIGGTTVTGADLTNSPYHTANENFTDSSWNRIPSWSSTYTTNFVWSNNSSANGISFDWLKNYGTKIVRGTGGSSVANSAINSGIYADTSVGGDGLRFNSTISDNRGVGMQVYGLAYGTYEIYLSGRNTGITSDYTNCFYAAVGHIIPPTSSSNSVTLDDFQLQESTAFFGTDKVDFWSFTSGNADASNYVKFTVEVSDTDPYLNLFTLGVDGSDVAQGYINSVQIIHVIPPAGTVISIR